MKTLASKNNFKKKKITKKLQLPLSLNKASVSHAIKGLRHEGEDEIIEQALPGNLEVEYVCLFLALLQSDILHLERVFLLLSFSLFFSLWHFPHKKQRQLSRSFSYFAFLSDSFRALLKHFFNVRNCFSHMPFCMSGRPCLMHAPYKPTSLEHRVSELKTDLEKLVATCFVIFLSSPRRSLAHSIQRLRPDATACYLLLSRAR